MVAANLREALDSFEPVIGLEVHAQLKTKSKLFCDAPNCFDPDKPNHFITEYCLGLPGVLPVLNEQAVDLAIKAGLALSCQIRATSVFARKQYFYPDLSKGYQISQYDQPICEEGQLTFSREDGTKAKVRIERIHMEEDAGKSIHVDGANYSVVDYNRAGVPLIEIVSKPDLQSAQDAASYLRTLRSLLRALNICDGNMEQGSFRCDANVSVKPKGQTELGTRCELKNINSFRFVEQAIEIEILRQVRLIQEGGQVTQETRLYDPNRKQTRSMRGKEDAHDYRYFADPDLPALTLSEDRINRIKEELPELPEAKRQRYLEELHVNPEAAQIIAEEPTLSAFFEEALAPSPKLAPGIANLIITEVLRELKDSPEAIAETKLSPRELERLVSLKEDGKISSTQQKKFFARLWKGETTLEHLLKEEGEQIGDADQLNPIIAQLIADHPKEAGQLREGKTKLMGFFVGRVMKATQGKANPAVVNKLISENLNKTK